MIHEQGIARIQKHHSLRKQKNNHRVTTRTSSRISGPQTDLFSKHLRTKVQETRFSMTLFDDSHHVTSRKKQKTDMKQIICCLNTKPLTR